MNKVNVFYARFISPGSFVAETWTAPLTSPDPSSVEWPERAYAFTIHQREDVADGTQRFKGETKRIGPIYYHPDSVVESLEEVAKNPKATSILIGNMKGNGWTHVVWTRWGNWPQPFEADRMQVLSAGGA